MPRDILFKEPDFVFSYRVGGIPIRDGKILLQRSQGDYAIIGGHVAALETTEETLRREFQEELHADISVDRLLAVGEVFFPWGQRPCHQVCFYYRVTLPADALPTEEIFHGWDELGGERFDLDYFWAPLEALRDGLKVYPLALIPHILADKEEIVHFVAHED